MEKEFFEAAAAGDAVNLKRLIEAGMDVNAMTMPGSNGRTALMIAAEKGHEDAVRMLIEKRADVNYRYGRSGYADYSDEDSALIFAARNGHAEVARILIQAGAKVNVKGSFDRTALISAAIGGSPEVVKLLLDCGADPDASTSHGDTALDYAVARKFSEISDLLENARHRPARKDHGGT